MVIITNSSSPKFMLCKIRTREDMAWKQFILLVEEKAYK